ncbi:bifunctional precorrin-2 dehydrogenase/sirohydrochlorin ferrochelatase [Sphingomonas bacterium]|uniref:precorrin-2 dehydrogenase/sirohydrochlorin ferrochelatase family protein n=1 Tax=Sphingomonas bacterium TaxID=1895847 RepID=UPI0015773BCA|nr:NAD(P)-dependent oxidoreductase [Sphingomonas bacterium]
MSLHSLPLFIRMAGRPVILLGAGEAADAKRRLLERAGAAIVGEDAAAALAIVAIDDEGEALAAVARLKARGVLVNAVDRPDHCDFTVPAIVDRSPVLVAVGTGGVSAGLAAALRQRIEGMLPAALGALATALSDARGAMRTRYPDGAARRRAIGAALSAGGVLDPLGPAPDVAAWLADGGTVTGSVRRIMLRSGDPDDLTLGEARALAQADRVVHAADVPAAILDRARADAVRIAAGTPLAAMEGLTVALEMAA